MDPLPPLIGSAAGLVLLLAGALLRGGDGRRLPALLLGASAALGAVIATMLASGLELGLPPSAFRDWALVALAGAGVLGAAAGSGAKGARAAALALAAGLVALFWFPTDSLHERYWNGEVALHVAGLAGVTLVGTFIRWGHGPLERVPEGMLAFGLAGVCAAPTLGWTGTGVSASLAGALAGSAGLFGVVLAVGSRLRSELGGIGSAAGTSQTVGLAGALATGSLYAETPLWSSAVLMLAPAWTLLPGKGLKGSILRLLLVAASAATPAILAYLDQPEPNPYGGY